MKREVPAVRIFPMSDKIPGFRGRSIEEVQSEVFLKKLPEMGGSFRYSKGGLKAEPGTVVLFQFKARVIAYGVFLRDEKFEKPRGGSNGELFFEAGAFRVFEPVDVEGMRKVWERFRGFGHVKQGLNPTLWGEFRRRLKGVRKA